MWTDPEIKALSPKPKSYVLSEKTRERGAGRLAVEIRPDGSKHFYFLYYWQGKRRLVLIDRYKDNPRTKGLKLREARDEVERYSKLYKQGLDVKQYLADLAAKEAAKARRESQRGSFQQLVESYTANMRADGKRTWAAVLVELERYVFEPFPHLKDIKAAEITVYDIKQILSRMINELGITTHSNRVRSYLHAAFQHGLQQDNNPRNHLHSAVSFNLTSNPVAAIPRQKDFEKVGERHLTDEELKALWVACDSEFGAVVGRAIRFMFATCGQRPNEILSAPWGWYDLDKAVLELPGSVTKNKRPHVVPLNGIALQVLEELKPLTGESAYPFAGNPRITKGEEKPVRSDSINRAIARFCKAEKWPHERFVTRDIRRTVKTQMGKAGLDKSIRDRLQNHALQDVSSVHYDRYDYLKEKRQAAEKWGAYLELLIKPKENVVHFSRSAK